MGVGGQFGPDGPAMFRVGTAVVVGAASAIVIGLTAGWKYAPPAGWLVTAIIYLTWTWALIRHMTAAETKEHARRRQEEDATRTWSHVIMLLASIASLAGVGYLLLAQTSKSGDVVAAAVGALSVVASWFAAHTVFMLRYARLFYSGAEDGIDFNQGHDPKSQPTYRDFAYLAFTIGMTYQVFGHQHQGPQHPFHCAGPRDAVVLPRRDHPGGHHQPRRGIGQLQQVSPVAR
jgi:uncharacterized membrane protein